MKRISLAFPLVFTIGLLAGCDREPVIAPQVPVSPAPAATPVESTATAPVTDAVVEIQEPVAEVVPVPAARKITHAATPKARKKEQALPPGFIKIMSGNQLVVIARQPVSVDQMRLWAESAEGRRLPHLASEQSGVIATDLDWAAADAYAHWLSAKERRHYRLPTEMEWLHAAQSGRIDTQAQRSETEPPLWEWTGDCWSEGAPPSADAAVNDSERCASRVLVGGEVSAGSSWGRAPMGARRPAASFRLVLETH